MNKNGSHCQLGLMMGFYLSLVVLYIEEGVIVRKLDHLVGMFKGFMNDG